MLLAGQQAVLSIKGSNFRRINSTYGSVLYLAGNSNATITNTIMQDLSATSDGGAAYIRDNSSLSVINSTIQGSQAQYAAGLLCHDDSTLVVRKSVLQYNRAARNGGGVSADRKCKVVLDGVSLLNNEAVYGGAVVAWGNASVTVAGGCLIANNSASEAAWLFLSDNSSTTLLQVALVNNTAQENGAGVQAIRSAQLTVHNSSFQANNAGSMGGAISLEGSSRALIRGTTIASNNAKYGGGMRCSENSTAELHAVSFLNNSASTSGAGLLLTNTKQVVVHNCSFTSNQAGTWGGAVTLVGSGRALIKGTNFTSIRAVLGAALVAGGSSKLELDSAFLQRNNASEHGGAAVVYESAQVLVHNCTLSNSSSRVGGAVAARSDAYVAIHDSRIVFNRASSPVGSGGGLAFSDKSNLTQLLLSNNSAGATGGGLALLGDAKVTATGVMFEGNSAKYGGGFSLFGAAEMRLSKCTVRHNKATDSGGGALLEGSSVLHVDPTNTAINDNVAAEFGGGVNAISREFDVNDLLAVTSNNTAQHDADVSVNVTSLTLSGDTSKNGFVSRPGIEGILPLKLNVSGHFGLPCAGLAVTAALNGLYVLGLNTSDAHGMVHMLLRVQQPPGQYNITFTLFEESTVPPAVLSLQVRPCVRGEVAPTADTCQVCLPGSYSLHPSQHACQPCPPAGADCPGGAAILPLPGWWHSAADSAQIHRCPNAEACHGDRAALHACANNTMCWSSHNSYTSQQCAAAYTGNIAS
uniref:Right handed beta helix domain-containing protein n=1 Tax=Tetradesmus obliquus TaxID=3088 RepID=A0A383VDP1_TETOB|eukprot:jgi/Sobl393_1/2108/SZX62832.1